MRVVAAAAVGEPLCSAEHSMTCSCRAIAHCIPSGERRCPPALGAGGPRPRVALRVARAERREVVLAARAAAQVRAVPFARRGAGARHGLRAAPRRDERPAAPRASGNSRSKARGVAENARCRGRATWSPQSSRTHVGRRCARVLAGEREMPRAGDVVAAVRLAPTWVVDARVSLLENARCRGRATWSPQSVSHPRGSSMRALLAGRTRDAAGGRRGRRSPSRTHVGRRCARPCWELDMAASQFVPTWVVDARAWLWFGVGQAIAQAPSIIGPPIGTKDRAKKIDEQISFAVESC